MTPTSVSYTHLDVYKRQLLIRGSLVQVQEEEQKEVYRKIDLFFVSALLPPASKIELSLIHISPYRAETEYDLRYQPEKNKQKKE